MASTDVQVLPREVLVLTVRRIAIKRIIKLAYDRRVDSDCVKSDLHEALVATNVDIDRLQRTNRIGEHAATALTAAVDLLQGIIKTQGFGTLFETAVKNLMGVFVVCNVPVTNLEVISEKYSDQTQQTFPQRVLRQVNRRFWGIFNDVVHSHRSYVGVDKLSSSHRHLDQFSAKTIEDEINAKFKQSRSIYVADCDLFVDKALDISGSTSGSNSLADAQLKEWEAMLDDRDDFVDEKVQQFEKIVRCWVDELSVAMPPKIPNLLSWFRMVLSLNVYTIAEKF